MSKVSLKKNLNPYLGSKQPDLGAMWEETSRGIRQVSFSMYSWYITLTIIKKDRIVSFGHASVDVSRGWQILIFGFSAFCYEVSWLFLR